MCFYHILLYCNKKVIMIFDTMYLLAHDWNGVLTELNECISVSAGVG